MLAGKYCVSLGYLLALGGDWRRGCGSHGEDFEIWKLTFLQRSWLMKGKMPLEPGPRIREENPGNWGGIMELTLLNTLPPLPSFLKSPLLFRCPPSPDSGCIVIGPSLSRCLPVLPTIELSLNVWCNSDQWPMAFQNHFLYRQKETHRKTQTISLCWTLSCLEVQQLSCNQEESQTDGLVTPEEDRQEKWKEPEPLLMTLSPQINQSWNHPTLDFLEYSIINYPCCSGPSHWSPLLLWPQDTKWLR